MSPRKLIPHPRAVAVKVRPHVVASLDGLIAIATYDLLRSALLAGVVLAAVRCHS